jgi:hypothetical protein
MGFNFFKSFTESIKTPQEDKRLERKEAEEYGKNTNEKSEDIMEKGRNLKIKEKFDGLNDQEEWREDEARLKEPDTFRTQDDVYENEQIYGEDISDEDKIYEQVDASLGRGETDLDKKTLSDGERAEQEEEEITAEWRRDAEKFLSPKDAKKFIAYLESKENELDQRRQSEFENLLAGEDYENEEDKENDSRTPSSTPPSDIVNLFKKINQARVKEDKKDKVLDKHEQKAEDLALMKEAYKRVSSTNWREPLLDSKGQVIAPERVLELANEYGEYKVKIGDWGKGTFKIGHFRGRDQDQEQLVKYVPGPNGKMEKIIADIDDPGDYFYDLTKKSIVASKKDPRMTYVFVKLIPGLLPQKLEHKGKRQKESRASLKKVA